MELSRVRQAIRDVPGFPKEGIVFKDITPVLSDGSLFREVVDHFAARHRGAKLDKVAGVEARGFLFGAAVAYALGVGFVPIRKEGKLPWLVMKESYHLEYGMATVEMHQDAVCAGERVLLVDDLLATGGTAAAAAHLIRAHGATVVEIDFLIELAFLEGRKKLTGYEVYAPIVY